MVKNHPFEIIQGGFSEPILQPCYLVGIGTIFLLSPYLGWFLSTLVVSVPAFYIAVKISKKQDERYSVLREIAWDQMNLFININDLNSVLRVNKRSINSAIIKQSLNVSYKEASILTNKLITSGLASKQVQKVAQDNPVEVKQNSPSKLAHVSQVNF